MDINTIRGLSTLLLMIVFMGIVFWAYSGRRKKDFEEAALLPLRDDVPAPAHRNEQNAKGNRDE